MLPFQSCSEWGLHGIPRYRGIGGLLPRLSILTALPCGNTAVYFCCTFLEVAFTGISPAPCLVMLGLSSSCDATVRLTRKASIPEKPGDVKEFDKGKRWNAVLPGGKSDAPCGAMCAFGTLRRRTCTFPLFSTYTVFTLEA